MSLETVPWFVGGGAEHSPDVARQVAYAATGSTGGVLGNLDFRVTELPIPGTSIRMAAGAAAIPNGYLPAPDFGKQSYVARGDSVTDIPVTATDSGGGRVDLVVLRIDDPQFGGQEPVDPAVGPYVRFEIIENVPAGTKTVPAGTPYPAIPLARLDIPASTGTIVQGHITDLRKVANPKRTRDLYNTQPTSASTISTTSGSFSAWTPQANRTIEIPSWATQVKIVGHLGGVICKTGDLIGFARPRLGTLIAQEVAFDLDVNTRSTMLAADTLDIPAAMRNTTQVLSLEARRSNGTGSLETDAYSTVLWDIEFLEVASSD